MKNVSGLSFPRSHQLVWITALQPAGNVSCTAPTNKNLTSDPLAPQPLPRFSPFPFLSKMIFHHDPPREEWCGAQKSDKAVVISLDGKLSLHSDVTAPSKTLDTHAKGAGIIHLETQNIKHAIDSSLDSGDRWNSAVEQSSPLFPLLCGINIEC